MNALYAGERAPSSGEAAAGVEGKYVLQNVVVRCWMNGGFPQRGASDNPAWLNSLTRLDNSDDTIWVCC